MNIIDFNAHVSGEALRRHTIAVHCGKLLEDCPACRELQAKREKFQKMEFSDFPVKPVKKGFRPYIDPGHNSTSTCRNHRHSTCSSKHKGNHGLPGEKCTCECHLDLTFQENYVE